MDLRRDQNDDGVLTVTMDDGKKNAFDTDGFRALAKAFDDAGDARAVVLAGREGIFTAGLNVKFIAQADRPQMHELLVAFGQTLMRIWTEPKPVVAAATGHAVAAGTMLAMACDHAVAAEGDCYWGLTETRIDFEMPQFGITLAQHNVRSDRVDDLILPGAQIPAAEAVEVGYADELAPADAVIRRAQERAADLATLPPNAYAGTKRRLRGDAAEAVLAGLDADLDALLVNFPPS